MIEWYEDLSVGNDEIDEQHKVLIDLINDFYLAVDQNIFSEQVSSLKLVADYAVKHFANEEALLKLHRYPDIKQHELIHKQLLQRLNELKNDLLNNNSDIGDKIKYFLKNWVTAHIQGIDKKYSGHLALSINSTI